MTRFEPGKTYYCDYDYRTLKVLSRTETTVTVLGLFRSRETIQHDRDGNEFFTVGDEIRKYRYSALNLDK